METLTIYLPMDRRHALAHGQTLCDRTHGAALFADISGFTPLTEALVNELGPQRGAEELTHYLNLVYDAVIDEVHCYGGSVIAFAGDAITCWFDGDSTLRAMAAALAMQSAMHQFSAIRTPAGSTVELAMKAAIATGPARRFLIGDPAIRVIDAVAGDTLVRLAGAEQLAQKGEVVLDGADLPAFAEIVQISEQRQDEQTGQKIGVVIGLHQPVDQAPWTLLPPNALSEDQVRKWLLVPVYERLRRGLGNFLAELRTTVALFVRFSGIDYDNDDEAEAKLNVYVSWVQRTVARFEGTLIDLNIGDKGSYIYINFGAPLTHEDNADRAAAAALALRDQPQALGYIRTVQMGISQGRMRAGAYGGTSHSTYGVLGDEVNMAARLMMAAKPSQILISQEVQRSLGTRFILEELPPIRVKGKSQPAVIFALVDVRQAHELHLIPAAYALPMVGRQDELKVAAEKIERVVHGEGQIIGVTGEAGLGKSRLVAEIMKLAGEHHFTIYGGACESYGVDSSYLVWQPIWQRIFGLDSAWNLTKQIDVLQEKLEAIDPAFTPRLPLLSVVLNLDLPDNDLTHSLDAKLRKDLLHLLLVDCLRAEARKAPLLIILETCQWIDPLSQELLDIIGNGISNMPVMLVLAYRPQEREQSHLMNVRQLPRYTEIALNPLTSEEAAKIVNLKLVQLVGTDVHVPSTLMQRLALQAEGNPFYLEELISYLHYRGINFSDGAALDKVELPESLQRLVLSLIDQLSESQKIAVKVASVVGRVFRAAWLYSVYPEHGDLTEVHADLEALCQHELMSREPSESELVYLFRQVLTQGVTYESLPLSVRSILHEQIAHFIEQTYADALDQHLDLLTYHYEHSTNLEKQRYYLLRAGEAAQANYANVVAINYFKRLLPRLEIQDQGAVLLKLAQVLDTVGEYEEADTHLCEALALAEQQGDQYLQIQCQIALGELRRKQSQYGEAAAYFALAQAASEQLGDQASVAKALVCAGSLTLYQGDYAKAQAYYARSLVIRRELNDQPNIAKVLNNMAITAANQGDLAQASALFEESLTIRRGLRDQWGVANSLNNLGELALLQQAYLEARNYLEEAVTALREIGDKWSLGMSLLNLGNALRDQENFTAAYPLYQESLQINRELGDRWMLAYSLENFGVLLALQGDAARALHLAGAAAALRETLGTPLSPAEKSQLDNALEPAHQALGAAAPSVWEVGRALTLEQAIDEALHIGLPGRKEG
jgi:adenylate cyclase